MKIEIAQRYNPFSHTPGIKALLPKSFWSLEAFPTLLRFKNLHTLETHELFLALQGPVQDFTLIQNLERGELSLFGKSRQGYFRARISYTERGIELFFERAPDQGFLCELAAKKERVHNKTELLLPVKKEELLLASNEERLSLGMHKSQDWDLIRRRADLKEILPFWLALAGWIPEVKDPGTIVGTLHTLQECKEGIQSGRREEIAHSLQKAFLAGFSGLLMPSLQDELYQGIAPKDEKIPKDLSPLVFLKRGKELIRSLFFQEKAGEMELLPFLPPEFPVGRMTGIVTQNGNRIDLEWSKKLLRRVVIHAGTTETLALALQKPLKSFRLRHREKERGQTIQRGEKLQLRAGEKLFLDRFEK